MLSLTTPSDNLQPCYFSLETFAINDYSTETLYNSPPTTPTEVVDPTDHPLSWEIPTLFGSSPPALEFGESSFLQMQTAVAHKQSPSRPRPYPVQNVLHVTSDDAMSSDSSASSLGSNKSSFDMARCSRCQRAGSTEYLPGKSNMVQYGLNLWYCNRCASIVGLKNNR